MTKKTLYVSRPVINHDEIAAWAKEQGFESTLGDDMHVTIAFSKTPVDWDLVDPDTSPVSVFGIDKREIKPLGDEGAIVLRFEDPIIRARWNELKSAGADWSYPEYQSHVTISYSAGDIDLSEIEPYMGKIDFGPERIKEINSNWENEIKETPVKKQLTTTQILKVDRGLGLVFGYAIVCKERSGRVMKDHYDLQDDHVPEETMLKASLDFAMNYSVAKDMHSGDTFGGYPFLFPMTEEIAKALDIKIDKSGLLVGFKPDRDDILEKYESGEYTGFSIGGSEVEVVEVG